MNDPRSKMMISPGLLPTESLLDSLVLITSEISSIEKFPLVQIKNVSSMIRRIKLLSSLFEEIQESDTPLPPSSILCFTEIFSVITRVKILIQELKDGSSLWSLIQLEFISNQFFVLVKEFGRAFDILPLNLLNITHDIKEQIELVHKQAKRVELFIDPREVQRREKLLQVMSKNCLQNNKNNKGFIDFLKVEEIMSSIGLITLLDYVEEISKLEVEAQNQAGTGGLIVVSNINNLMLLVSYTKSMVFRNGEKSDGEYSDEITLLASKDSRIQEHVVTALFNLSIYDNNKILIMAAGAVDNIVEVLESGKTMEARENAAAAIYSLSMLDDCKVQIGASSKAIPALVLLLKEGTPIGKRDAAIALFNLAVYNPNKLSIVKSGAVSLLVELLMDDKASITDDSLAVLAVLLGCSQGLEEIKNSKSLVPILIDLLRFGSVKGKENSITVLLGLCKEEGEMVARKLLANPRSIPSLQSLAADGSLRARRKADALLRLLNRCCSQPQHSL
ncbi:E3 ubiquitin-protein ligase pub1 [Trifolium repens]|nr:E3 ubiquitin-protein ligase pub1 [Trifolium repens]